MKIEYDEEKKRIVIDAEGETLFKDVDGKKVLIPTIEIENDAKKPEPEFQAVVIDNILVSVSENRDTTFPIRISVLYQAKHGQDRDGRDSPGDILSTTNALVLSKALGDAVDYLENRQDEF